MRHFLSCFLLALLATLPLSRPSLVQAQQAPSAAEAISPYLTDQCVGVIRIQVAKLPVAKLVHQLVEMVPEAAQQEAEQAKHMEAVQKALLAAGVEEVYLVLTKDSLPKEPGYWIVPKNEHTDLLKIEKLLVDFRLMPRNVQLTDLDGVIYIGPPAAFVFLKDHAAKPRPELEAALRAVDRHAVQVALVPTDDDRRVIEELMPRLPQELGGGPSTALTHGVRWAALGFSATDELEVQLVVQSQDQAAATAFQGLWKSGLDYLTNLEVVTKVAPQLNQATKILTPQVENDQLTLTLNQQNKSIETLLAALKPPVMEARLRAKRVQSVNNLKHIALAMHNFYDVNKRFPAIGSVDATGRPLLSWRVHLLPYLEQNELYEQFHLDEPWDSTHNKTLIEKMPIYFVCPSSGHDQSKGLSTYRLVVGEGTAFPGREGIELKEITDGTSNTIMALEVDDQHAVVWTKPEGLPLNAENPLEGIGGQFPGGFNAATCDGAVHFIPQTIDKEKFLLLLLRADGNPVDWR